MKIVIEKAKSVKTQREYIWMYVNLGYTKKALSFIAADIAEMLGISVYDLMTRLKEIGDTIILEAKEV